VHATTVAYYNGLCSLAKLKFKRGVETAMRNEKEKHPPSLNTMWQMFLFFIFSQFFLIVNIVLSFGQDYLGKI